MQLIRPGLGDRVHYAAGGLTVFRAVIAGAHLEFLDRIGAVHIGDDNRAPARFGEKCLRVVRAVHRVPVVEAEIPRKLLSPLVPSVVTAGVSSTKFSQRRATSGNPLTSSWLTSCDCSVFSVSSTGASAVTVIEVCRAASGSWTSTVTLSPTWTTTPLLITVLKTALAGGDFIISRLQVWGDIDPGSFVV